MRRLRIRERQVPIGPLHSMLVKFTSVERQKIREAAERDGQPMRQWVRAVAVHAAETTHAD